MPRPDVAFGEVKVEAERNPSGMVQVTAQQEKIDVKAIDGIPIGGGSSPVTGPPPPRPLEVKESISSMSLDSVIKKKSLSKSLSPSMSTSIVESEPEDKKQAGIITAPLEKAEVPKTPESKAMPLDEKQKVPLTEERRVVMAEEEKTTLKLNTLVGPEVKENDKKDSLVLDKGAAPTVQTPAPKLINSPSKTLGPNAKTATAAVSQKVLKEEKSENSLNVSGSLKAEDIDDSDAARKESPKQNSHSLIVALKGKEMKIEDGLNAPDLIQKKVQ